MEPTEREGMMQDLVAMAEDRDAATARAEAAEAELAQLRELYADRDADLRHEYKRENDAEAKLLSVREALADMIDERDAALAEVETLRAQVAKLADLLRDAPIGFEDYTYEAWYASVSDYLESLDDARQDAP